MASAYYISEDDNGRAEHLLGYGRDAKEMANRSVQDIESEPWFYGDWLNEANGGVFPLSVVIMVGQPMCSKSVNIHGKGRATSSVCHATEREP